MSNVKKILKEVFGYEEFRSNQNEIIDHILSDSGKDGTLVVMPTGGGKSLTFQIPSIASENLSIVISPLISLMKDQVDTLKKKGIEAEYINSTLNKEQFKAVLKKLYFDQVKILYVAPERLKTPIFKKVLSGKKIDIFAVDESHCISSWGAGFRPSYRKIGEAIKWIKPKKIVALTATANDKVKVDIGVNLGIPKAKLFCSGFFREDLKIKVKECFSKSLKPCVDLILDNYDPDEDKKCGIVYTVTRKEAEDLQKEIKRYGIPCHYYHAGLEADKRNKIQEEWIKKDGIIIATNAFGMGIDKPNVRFVINYGLPASVEEWYQEIGRGSRDGKGCECILINTGDFIRKYLVSIEYPPVREVKTFEQWLIKQNKYGKSEIKMTQEKMGLCAGVKKQFSGGCVRYFLREGVLQKIKNGMYKIIELKQMDYDQYELDKRDKEKDIEILKQLIDKSGCRMNNFSYYFGETTDRKCELCDHCEKY